MRGQSEARGKGPWASLRSEGNLQSRVAILVKASATQAVPLPFWQETVGDSIGYKISGDSKVSLGLSASLLFRCTVVI